MQIYQMYIVNNIDHMVKNKKGSLSTPSKI